MPDHGKIEVTILDCSNTIVFVRAKDLGIKETELVELNQNKDVMEHIERIHCLSAQFCGFVTNWEDDRTKSTSLPKITIISTPQNYIDMDGNLVKSEEMDVCVHAMSVGALHKAYPITVAIATGAAVLLLSTIVSDMIHMSPCSTVVRLGHSSGVTNVDVRINGDTVIKGGVTRSARRIMDGYIYIRD